MFQELSGTVEIEMWYKPQRSLRPCSRDANELLILDVGPNVRATDREVVNCFRLNKTAAEIWTLCDGKHDVATMVSVISQKYGIDAQEARLDITELLRGLAEQGFLELNHESFF